MNELRYIEDALASLLPMLRSKKNDLDSILL